MPSTKAYTRVNFENYPSTNTPVNETNLNKLDKGIDDLDDLLVTARNNIETLGTSMQNVEQDLSTFAFRVDSVTQKKQVSSDNGVTWENFSGGVYYLGTGTSFNVAALFPNDYANLTVDNFIFQPGTISCSVNGNGGFRTYMSTTGSVNISKNYNASTGAFTLTNTSKSLSVRDSETQASANSTASLTNIKVYLVIGDIESV